VENGPTVVEVNLANVEHGPNPWHVHEYGGDGESCGPDETGGHFNPAGYPLQGELGWLLGNLKVDPARPGNVVAMKGVAHGVTLHGYDSIVGRSVVLHEQDGTRMACALIGDEEDRIQAPGFFGDIFGTSAGDWISLIVAVLLLFAITAAYYYYFRAKSSERVAVEQAITSKLPAFLVGRTPSQVVAEFVGTMVLSVAYGLTGKESPTVMPLAVGFIYVGIIYAGGHISSHYNPAVTLAVLVRGSIDKVEAAMHIAAQLLGAWFGTLFVFCLIGHRTAGYPQLGGSSELSAFIAELVFTFALCFTMLHVSTAPQQDGNSYYGFAVGFVALSGILCIGPITGGALNPALGAIGILHGKIEFWVYWIAEIAAALLAGMMFRLETKFGASAIDEMLEPNFDDNKDHPHRLGLSLVTEMTGSLCLCFAVATSRSSLHWSPAQLSQHVVQTKYHMHDVEMEVNPLNQPENNQMWTLAIGALWIALTYQGGHASGAHFSPSTTVAVFLRSKLGAKTLTFSTRSFVSYLVCQVIGCVGGAWLAVICLGPDGQIGYVRTASFLPNSSSQSMPCF
jgi:aquaporin Z